MFSEHNFQLFCVLSNSEAGTCSTPVFRNGNSILYSYGIHNICSQKISNGMLLFSVIRTDPFRKTKGDRSSDKKIVIHHNVPIVP
ncbi:hypothetical protein SAMN02927921_03618 [Sinomicrobium oceani]|uniref:Uncharacterized protein n=1 Tax=Sinomicrobium oceani TaxID=1150368 RepID=A0A1K1RI15_9FLAO|nr:hypothetical protein SAMN02927921_03618 [Sinomicrobium oceani]